VEAFARFYDAAKAALERYESQFTRLRRRVQPSVN